MMSSFEQSPQRYARIGGVMYLAIIVLGLFGEAFVRGSLVAGGDATATAQAIAGSESLWRAGIVGDLLMHVLDLPVILVLYLLLRPVSEALALLATFFNLIQTAVLVANKMTLVVPILLLRPSAGLGSFAPEQLHALAYAAISAHDYGFGIGLIFFGFACLVRGYLISQCAYVPKVFGPLLALAGLSYIVNSVALLLAPSLAAAMFPYILLPAFVGELAFALWLTFKGVNLERWRR
jgi:hypothetical protein